MASRALDTEINRLYQLPLDEFTAARNALAKGAGADAARVRALGKPPIAAWAVNQLYWRNIDLWDRLIAAAENVRRAHRAVLSGRAGDVRAASRVHEDAVETALKATVALLVEAGHPATDATRQAIVTTLRALPADEPPGRLARPLQPGGFEMLADLPIARNAPGRRPKPAPKRGVLAAAPPPSRPAADAMALTRAREAAAAAVHAVREAEHAARREEFEVARTTRENERAAQAVEHARDALTRAKSELEQAEVAAKGATRQVGAAQERARVAKQALTGARSRAESAAADLKKID